MSKKLICLVSFVFILCVTANTSAELMAFYPMDDGSGNVVADATGNGHDGTIVGTPTWVEGAPAPDSQTALLFGEGATGGVECGTWDPSAETDQLSLAAWIKRGTSQEPRWQGIVNKREGWSDNCWQFGFSFGDLYFGSNVAAKFHITEEWPGSVAGEEAEWVHVAITFDGSDAIFYFNGEEYLDNGAMPFTAAFGANREATIRIGHDGPGSASLFNGPIDEVYIFDSVLSPEEVILVMEGAYKIGGNSASKPSPAKDSTEISRDVVLSWTPGTVDGKSDVYFGTSFEDANDGAAVSPSQDANSYDPGRLEFDTPYFWRVDDINSADATVTKGTVWSFTTEPKSIMMPADQISATASSYGGDPNVTIDGTGLNSEGQHGFDTSTMWLSGGEADAWLQYRFDTAKKLDVMRVWNHNSQLEVAFGFGAKQVTVSHSLDGENWTVLAGVSPFEQATGKADYVANTQVDFAGAVAQHVRIVINSNWGSAAPQTGLSEVQFMAIPEAARNPQPDTGAVDVELEPVLKWRAGRHAAEHVVYLSSDLSAVEDGSAPSETVAINQYAAPGLVLGQTYYWRVDEVNDAEVPASWEGSIWNFTTEAYVTIDDFESYNDTWGNIIFQSWLDGYGWEDAEGNSQEGNGTGSAVGYWPPPTVEDANVYDGDQSMPLAYGLDGKTLSETTHTLPSPQPVSQFGITTLSLQFYGSAANVPGQLFVKINGQKVSDYPGSQDDMKLAEWHSWTIDVTGITSISSITIGVTGGSGTVFIDAIYLLPATN